MDLDWKDYRTESMDLTKLGNGNGLSFYHIMKLIEYNEDTFSKAVDNGDLQNNDFSYNLYKHLKTENIGGGPEQFIELYGLKERFLSFHRSIQKDHTCVYSVFKNTKDKKITVSFRGSVFGGQDWGHNLTPGTTKLETPAIIKDKLPESLRENVLVRSGFHDYLFNEENMKDKKSRYDKIMEDIQTLLKQEPDYRVYVTGHSLGGALATILSFKIAGSGESDEESVPIPKPVTCITWAAPFAGTTGFRTATEHLEREGLLRSLRVSNSYDVVPTLPPKSRFVVGPRMAHVGVNVRLISNGVPIIQHSSRCNWRTAIRNSMLKPVWKFIQTSEHPPPTPHALAEYFNKWRDNKGFLQGLRLDDLYKDCNTIVSHDFIDGNETQDLDRSNSSFC